MVADLIKDFGRAGLRSVVKPRDSGHRWLFYVYVVVHRSIIEVQDLTVKFFNAIEFSPSYKDIRHAR